MLVPVSICDIVNITYHLMMAKSLLILSRGETVQ